MFKETCYPCSGALQIGNRTTGGSPYFRPPDHAILPTRPVGLAKRCNDGEQLWHGSIQIAQEFFASCIDAPPVLRVTGEGFAGIGPVFERRGIEQHLDGFAEPCQLAPGNGLWV